MSGPDPLYRRFYRMYPRSEYSRYSASSMPIGYRDFVRPNEPEWDPDDETWYEHKQGYRSAVNPRSVKPPADRPYRDYSSEELDKIRYNKRREAHDILARNHYFMGTPTSTVSESDQAAYNKAMYTWVEANNEEGYRHAETAQQVGESHSSYSNRQQRTAVQTEEREQHAQERQNTRKLQRHQEKEVIDQKKREAQERKQAKAYYKQQRMFES